MIDTDRGPFFALLADVYAFYNKDFTAFVGNVWWAAMRPYEFAAVNAAMGRHCANPDTGQFLPKPADVVRMLSGTTQDAALVAWAAVDRAVRTVGTWRSVVFPDGLTHRVITEMGGWIALGMRGEDEWPFVRNEFVNRFRGYRARSEAPEYPPHLPGLCEAQNSMMGFAAATPVLLGDPQRATAVMLGGSMTPILQVTHAAAALAPALEHIERRPA